MKSTLFKKVLNEEYIEVDKSIPDTIRFLIEQSGTSDNVTPDGLKLCFDCTKKGNISVRVHAIRLKGIYPLYAVYGKVISKNNKTYVKIISLYKSYNIWLRILSMILSVLLLPLIFLKAFIHNALNIYTIFILITVNTIALFQQCNAIMINKNSMSEIVTLMENEIKRRVENIKRWND